MSLFSTVTEEDAEDFNPLITIRLFIKYVDHLILIALEVSYVVYVKSYLIDFLFLPT